MAGLWLGIGCQRGVSDESIESAILQTLALQDLQLAEVMGVASIDHKAQEPGISEVCAKYHWQLQTYSATELDNVQIQQPSTTVAQLVGTNSVAEAAAMLPDHDGNQQLREIAASLLAHAAPCVRAPIMPSRSVRHVPARTWASARQVDVGRGHR